jgi:protein-S-isoprenylcysteine O-methyltransferase Ste14
MGRMAILLFVIILISESLLAGALILSLVKPSVRVWPPSRRSSWQQFLALTLNHVAKICTIPLGILDWNSFVLNHWLRFVFGGISVASGLLFALWGTWSLGIDMSVGVEGKLIKTGAYKYSRNPQYVGWCVFFVGYALICNSLLTFIATVIGAFLYYIVSFVEEPWLRERYGSQYEEYKSQVPRYIGSLKRKARHMSRPHA